MKDSGSLEIRVKLHGEQIQKFLKIKEELGLVNNSEVIRHIVSEKFREITEEESSGA